MPSFIGTWFTQRFRIDQPDALEQIELSITADANPGDLDGAYPRPGMDARIFGSIDGTGRVWYATIDKQGSTGLSGYARFVLSADGQRLHGAWVSTATGHDPQPWFGERV
jgi:hypothetical protein